MRRDVRRFNRIVNLIEHRPMLVRLGFKLTRNRSLSEDVADQTIGQALVNQAQWRGVNLGGWLRSIAVNVIRHHARDLKIRGPIDREIELARRGERTPLQNAINGEIGKALHSAIASLTEKQREAFKLAEVDGLPFKEIAERMGLRCGAVRALAFRARTALARELERFIA